MILKIKVLPHRIFVYLTDDPEDAVVRIFRNCLIMDFQDCKIYNQHNVVCESEKRYRFTKCTQNALILPTEGRVIFPFVITKYPTKNDIKIINTIKKTVLSQAVEVLQAPFVITEALLPRLYIDYKKVFSCVFCPKSAQRLCGDLSCCSATACCQTLQEIKATSIKESSDVQLQAL